MDAQFGAATESPAPSCRLAAEKSQHPCHCTQLYLSPKVLQVKHKLLLRDTSQLVLNLALEPRSRLNSTGTTMSLVSLSLIPPLGSCRNFPPQPEVYPKASKQHHCHQDPELPWACTAPCRGINMLQAEPPRKQNHPLTAQTPVGPGAGAAPRHSAFPLRMNRASREAAWEVTAAGQPSAGTVLPAPPPAPQEGGSDPMILAKVTKRDRFVLPTSSLF